MEKCEIHHDACACSESIFARAVELADRLMIMQLEGLAVPIEDSEAPSTEGLPQACSFGLCDKDQAEVSCLADADPAIREAFEWLSQRGLAVLREDEWGQFIALTPVRMQMTA